MASWLTLQENSHQIDEKMKQKLIENYIRMNSDKRTRRLKKLKGTVRQLYTEGEMEQADALWDQYMGNPMTEKTDDEVSTSSSE